MKVSKESRAAIEAAARGGAKSLGVVIPPELAPPAEPRKNKYGAKPKEYKGVRYASTSEANRAESLDEMLGAGFIKGWTRQPTFRLGCPENVYRADFVVVRLDGSRHVEDVKGVETSKFKRDRKLWVAYGECELWIVKAKGRGWQVEVVHPRKQGI